MSADQIIGYLAMKSRSELVCDGEALIIAGSHATLKRMLAKGAIDPVSSYKILKARFAEVVSGLARGGAYAFDRESYGRFSRLAKEERIPCGDFDFTPPTPDDIMLVTVVFPFGETEGNRANAGIVSVFQSQHGGRRGSL